jgi:hypothetical protein
MSDEDALLLESQRCVALILIAGILTTGCVKTREYKVARYEPRAQPITQPVPRDGWYKVKWKVRDEYKGVDDTARYLTRGTAVGFETAPDGNVIAIVDEDRVFVGPANRKAKYCCWYRKTKEPTQFAKEMRRALTVSGEVAAFIGLIIVEGVVNGLDDDDDDCNRSKRFQDGGYTFPR